MYTWEIEEARDARDFGDWPMDFGPDARDLADLASDTRTLDSSAWGTLDWADMMDAPVPF